MTTLFRPDSVAVSVSANAAAQAALRGVGLIRNVVLAWLIDPAQYGLFGIAMLVLNLLLPLCSLGLYEGIARYTPVYELDGTASRFARRVVLASMALAGAVTAAVLLGSGWIGPWAFSQVSAVAAAEAAASQAEAVSLMRASTLCALTLAMYHVMVAFLRGLRMFRVIALAELATALVFTASAIAAAGLGFGRAIVPIGCYAAANVASIVLLAPALRRAMHRLPPPGTRAARAPGPRLAAVLRFSLWSAGTAAAWNAMLFLPAWYLLRAVDRPTAGYFFGTRLIPHMVQYAGALLVSVVYAHATRAWERDGREAAVPLLDFLTRASLIALLVGTALLSVARPLLVRVFPDAYAAGVVAYDPLLALFMLSAVAGLLSVRLNLVERSSRVCISWAIGFAANLAAIYVLLEPRPGLSVVTAAQALTGAAWAGVLGVAAACAAMLVLVRPHRLSPDGRTWVLILAALAPAFGRVPAVTATAIVVALALAGRVVIDPDERKRILGPLRARWR
ncbi:MAG: hypothetical protein C4547_07245 [Phycisphaerales bacterium]|nr:MAG: hypothetical protein C4547_07245 [Phycisphaerales bacterium]